MWWLWLWEAIRWQADLLVAAAVIVGGTAVLLRRLPTLASTRSLAATAVISTAVCLALTVGLTWAGDRIVRDRIEEQLETLAQTFAGEFEQQGHARLDVGADPTGPESARLIARQKTLHEQHPELGAISTLRRDGADPDRQVVIFDDEIDLDGDGKLAGEAELRDPPGREWFVDGSTALRTAWEGVPAVNEYPTPDSGGYWISGYAPLRAGPEASAPVEALLRVDYPARLWVLQRAAGRAIGVTVGLLLTGLQMVVLILLGLTRLRYEDSRQKLTQSEAAGRLASGEVVRDLPVRFGRFELLRVLGRGGMGVVYEAEDTLRRERRAVKVLDTSITADRVSRARFEREINYLRRCHHENLVYAYEATPIDGIQVLVMELVRGTPVAALVPAGDDAPRPPALSVADACEIARQAALGLDYLHGKQILHRDIKPANLMITPQGRVKILDLGLSRLISSAGEEAQLTRTRQILGSYDYLPPEMAAVDHHAVDRRADFYSLGGTLFKMLAGRGPFEDAQHKSFAAKLLAHVGERAPDVRRVRPDVPAGVAAIVARLLEKEPAHRFDHGAEIAAALRPFCGGADLPALGRRGVGAEAVIDATPQGHSDTEVIAT